MKTNSMYAEEIMEIYARKPNYGVVKDKTHEATLKNPGCNDEFTIQMKIENDKITDAKFQGRGCVISTISIATLLSKIVGMTLEEAKNLSKKDMDKFLGIDIIPTRINCELLGLEIIKNIK